MTYLDLHRKLNDHPFRPFRIKMVNNSTVDILEPNMVFLGKSSAIVTTRSERDDRGVRVALDWKTISIAHILEFSDLPLRGNGSKRKR